MKPKKSLISPVRSLNELYNKACDDSKYEQLLLISASNLGMKCTTKRQAYNWLSTNAMETGDEQRVVDEVNFCRDLVK